MCEPRGTWLSTGMVKSATVCMGGIKCRQQSVQAWIEHSLIHSSVRVLDLNLILIEVMQRMVGV